MAQAQLFKKQILLDVARRLAPTAEARPAVTCPGCGRLRWPDGIRSCSYDRRIMTREAQLSAAGESLKSIRDLVWVGKEPGR